MITCGVQYQIDPCRLDAFEHYGRLRMALVSKYGGTHHGFLLPIDGEADLVTAYFSFPSLSDYAFYMAASVTDPDCIQACAYANETGCIRSMRRVFYRSLFDRVAT